MSKMSMENAQFRSRIERLLESEETPFITHSIDKENSYDCRDYQLELTASVENDKTKLSLEPVPASMRIKDVCERHGLDPSRIVIVNGRRNQEFIADYELGEMFSHPPRQSRQWNWGLSIRDEIPVPNDVNLDTSTSSHPKYWPVRNKRKCKLQRKSRKLNRK